MFPENEKMESSSDVTPHLPKKMHFEPTKEFTLHPDYDSALDEDYEDDHNLRCKDE